MFKAVGAWYAECMKTPFGWCRGAAPLLALILGVLSLGCSERGEGEVRRGGVRSEEKQTTLLTPRSSLPTPHSSPSPAPLAGLLLPPTAKKLGPHVYFERIPEGDRRRVYVEAVVCLREGQYGLEFLLCRKETKEYESVLQTEADARIIHLGLEAAGATAGSPVKFEPKFESPTGTPIQVTARYLDKGKLVTRPAQDWVRNVKTKKSLATDWVFAGSILAPDPNDAKGKPVYLATADGGYISVSNVPTAMLDLPIQSPKQLEDREFAPFTERIPPVDTKVVLVLEPLCKDKKK